MVRNFLHRTADGFRREFRQTVFEFVETVPPGVIRGHRDSSHPGPAAFYKPSVGNGDGGGADPQQPFAAGYAAAQFGRTDKQMNLKDRVCQNGSGQQMQVSAQQSQKLMQGGLEPLHLFQRGRWNGVLIAAAGIGPAGGVQRTAQVVTVTEPASLSGGFGNCRVASAVVSRPADHIIKTSASMPSFVQ